MNQIEHLMASTERELGAFIRAVSELYGTECAERAAEEWLDEFEQAELDPMNGVREMKREFRAVTIAAAVRLATRISAARRDVRWISDDIREPTGGLAHTSHQRPNCE